MAHSGSESPPHVPLPSPFIFGPNPILSSSSNSSSNYASRVNRTFATSSSSKRKRSSSSSSASSFDSNDEEEELEDPYAILKPEDEPVKSSSSGGGAGSHGTELEESNVGMRMLLKLGWSQGKGLGKDLQGRTQPIDPSGTTGMMGLGKAKQDTQMMDRVIESVSGVVELNSQKLAKETTDQKKARMEKAAHIEAVKSHVSNTLRNFKCDICDKQYQSIAQYDEHTNSYDHHHRARALATKLADRERNTRTGESDRRREKERKREEKEMAKRMGITLPMIVKVAGDKGKGKEDSLLLSSPTVAVKATPSTSTSTGFKKTGWTTFGSASSSSFSSSSIPLPPALPPPPPPPLTTGLVSHSASIPGAPSFRSGGLFSLTPGENAVAPLPPVFLPPPPPPPPSYQPPPPPPSLVAPYQPPPPPQSFYQPTPSSSDWNERNADHYGTSNNNYGQYQEERGGDGFNRQQHYSRQEDVIRQYGYGREPLPDDRRGGGESRYDGRERERYGDGDGNRGNDDRRDRDQYNDNNSRRDGRGDSRRDYDQNNRNERGGYNRRY